MLSNRTILLMTLLALVLGSLLACRTFSRSDTVAAPSGAKIWSRIARKLELSAEQQTQIKGQFLAEQDHLHGVLVRLYQARRSLRDAIQAPDASESSIRTAAARLSAVEADLALERLKLDRAIYPILKPAQREKLAALEQHADEVVDTALARLADGPAN